MAGHDTLRSQRRCGFSDLGADDTIRQRALMMPVSAAAKKVASNHPNPIIAQRNRRSARGVSAQSPTRGVEPRVSDPPEFPPGNRGDATLRIRVWGCQRSSCPSLTTENTILRRVTPLVMASNADLPALGWIVHRRAQLVGAMAPTDKTRILYFATTARAPNSYEPFKPLTHRRTEQADAQAIERSNPPCAQAVRPVPFS